MLIALVFEDAVSFYLKSRSHAQSFVTEFPTHAWSIPVGNGDSGPQQMLPEQYQASPTATSANTVITSSTRTPASDSQSSQFNDTFSDTASDSGAAPRSILKKRGSKSATLPRSHSSPSIRDSLELTKQSFKSLNHHGETPKVRMGLS